MPRQRSISKRLPAAPPKSTRVRPDDQIALLARVRANADARFAVLGVTKAEAARALGLQRQALDTRLRTLSGPAALRYLSVLLLCSEEALTASSPDAVRLAWRPGIDPSRWLPVVAKIIAAGRPLPTFEAARARVLDSLSAGGKQPG